MTKRIILCLITILLVAGLAFSHGDPIIGTVTAVSKDSITVKDNKDKSVVVMLEKATKYLKGDKPAAMADLKVGVRVVIDAHMDTKMKMFSAEEIKIGAAK